MSDALSDIAADERRARYFDTFADAVYAYLKNPHEEQRGAVVSAAEDTDSVRRGYWSGKTSLAQGAIETLARLSANDKAAWASWLNRFQHDHARYEAFKAISPFAGKTLVFKGYHTLDSADVDLHLYRKRVSRTSCDVVVFDGEPEDVISIGRKY